MITGRFAGPGKTRTCPHCRATILDSATVCPGCHHHLRFDSTGTSQRVQPAATPLRVEGTLRHPSNGGSWEYSVVLAIRNDRGEEIARQVVGVGALQPGDARTFSLAVEVFKPAELKEPKSQPAEASQRPAANAQSPDVRAPGRPGLPPAPPAPPKWPIQAPASTATTGRYPAAAASPGTSGRYPAAPAPPAAPSKAPASSKAPSPSKAPPTAAPPAPAPSRTATGQPLRAPQAPSLNGGAAAPARGAGPGVHPKRP